jgi:hypothetical protein
VAAGEVGRDPAGFEEPDLGAVPDREVAEGLGDVCFSDADGSVQDDGFACVQPAQRSAARSRICAAGSFGLALGRQVRRDPPANDAIEVSRGCSSRKPLMNRRLRHRNRQLFDDVVPVDLDLRPRHLPQPGIDQLRESAPHQPSPLGAALDRPTRHDPGRNRRRTYLRIVFRSTPRLAASSCCDRPACQWTKVSEISIT